MAQGGRGSCSRRRYRCPCRRHSPYPYTRTRTRTRARARTRARPRARTPPPTPAPTRTPPPHPDPGPIPTPTPNPTTDHAAGAEPRSVRGVGLWPRLAAATAATAAAATAATAAAATAAAATGGGGRRVLEPDLAPGLATVAGRPPPRLGLTGDAAETLRADGNTASAVSLGRQALPSGLRLESAQRALSTTTCTCTICTLQSCRAHAALRLLSECY